MFNLSLKSVNINNRMSEETTCFSAKVYLDGRHVFDVSNHGHGGGDDWHPVKGGYTMAEIYAFNDQIKATYPPVVITCLGDTVTTPADLETVVAELLTEYAVIKDVRRNSKKKLLFLSDGMKITEEMRQIPLPSTSTGFIKWWADVKAHVEKKYPGAVILNELTDEQITALVRKDRASC